MEVVFFMVFFGGVFYDIFFFVCQRGVKFFQCINVIVQKEIVLFWNVSVLNNYGVINVLVLSLIVFDQFIYIQNLILFKVLIDMI